MTYAEFLQRLAETPRDWYVNSSGEIRRVGSQCPISALCGWSAALFDRAAEKLGLSLDYADAIMRAADDRHVVAIDGDTLDAGATYQAKVRGDLLKACGLQ